MVYWLDSFRLFGGAEAGEHDQREVVGDVVGWICIHCGGAQLPLHEAAEGQAVSNEGLVGRSSKLHVVVCGALLRRLTALMVHVRLVRCSSLVALRSPPWHVHRGSASTDAAAVHILRSSHNSPPNIHHFTLPERPPPKYC